MAGVILVPTDPNSSNTSSDTGTVDDTSSCSLADALNVSSSTDSYDSKVLGSAGELKFSFSENGVVGTEASVPLLRSLDLGSVGARLNLFHELDDLLIFDHPRVRSECAGMIARIVPQLSRADLDRCMSVVLPRLVENLGHTDTEVQKSAADCLVVYFRKALDSQVPICALLEHGLLRSEQPLRSRIIESLPLLYAHDLTNIDWEQLFRCLLFLAVEDQKLRDIVLVALHDLKEFVSHDRMLQFIQQMNDSDRQRAVQVLRECAVFSVLSDGSDYRFSFVDAEVMDQVVDKVSWSRRIQGVEELNLIVKNTQDVESLLGEMHNFFQLLAELLEADNFKITLLTLEMYDVLIDKLKWRAKEFLPLIVDAVVGHLGESRSVVRMQSSKALCNLTHSCGPAPVVSALCANLANLQRRSNSRTREELLNAIILALLTFPSYEFDLYGVCTTVAPLVLDPKCRVRHAALECLAVLAQAMGSSRLATMASAIDAAARPHQDTEAALAAVLARLARRQLPRITSEGHVEYSLRVAAGGRLNSRGAFASQGPSQGADVDWILAGSGPLNSAGIQSGNLHSGSETGSRTGSVDKVKQPMSFPSSPASLRRVVSPPRSHCHQQSGSWTQLDNSNNQGLRHHPGSVNNDAVDGLPSVPAPRNQQNLYHTSPRLDDARTTARTRGGPSRAGGAHTMRGGGGGLLLKKSGDCYQEPKSDNRNISSGMKISNEDKHARPLDKVAAMLGHNILPSKLYPISDHVRGGDQGGSRSLMSTSVTPLPGKGPGTSLSSTWPVPGTLPALPAAAKSSFNSDTPIHTRPTLVRSSSGGKRTRIVTGNIPAQTNTTNLSSVITHSAPDSVTAIDGRAEGSRKLSERRLSSGSGVPRERLLSRLPNSEGEETITRVSLDDVSNINLWSGLELLPKDLRPRSVELHRSDFFHDNRGKLSSPVSPSRHSLKEGDVEPASSDDLVGQVNGLSTAEDAPVGNPDGKRSASCFRSARVRPASESHFSSQNGAAPSSGRLRAFGKRPKAQTDHLILSSSVTNTHLAHNGFNVVGKGMLPFSDDTNRLRGASTSPPVPTHRHRVEGTGHVLPSVRGRSVPHRDSADRNASPEDEDSHAMSMSRSTLAKMMNRKMEIVQEAERRQADHQRFEDDQEAYRDEYYLDNNNKTDLVNGNGPVSLKPKTPPGKPATTRRRFRTCGKNEFGRGHDNGLEGNSTTRSMFAKNHDSTVRNPEETLRMAFDKVRNDDWNSKCEGIKMVEALARQHPAVISADIHNVNLAVLAEVKNLRSTVARAAIQCIAELFASTKKVMENDLEMICKTLLHKSGETNVFIKEDVERSMTQMVEDVTPQKACLAIVLGGATHRNAAVRKTAAQFLCVVCEKLGPARILSGTKDVTDRILPTAAQFVMDGSPLTRYYGRKIFFMLLGSSEFDRVLSQSLQASTLRNIQDILETLRTKGLGARPNESASSRKLKASLK